MESKKALLSFSLGDAGQPGLLIHNEGEWQLVGWYNEPMGNTK